MGSHKYVNKHVNICRAAVLYLDVFVDIWSISPLTLQVQMNISKCEFEYGLLVYKNALIYIALCSIVSNI